MATIEDPPVLGFAYGEWKDDPNVADGKRRQVWAVLADRTDDDGTRWVQVRMLRDQRGYGDVVRAHERHWAVWANRPIWLMSTLFASVFVGTPTLLEGAVWAAKPKYRHLLGEGEVDPVLTGEAPLNWRAAPGRLGPVNPDGQPHA